EGDAAEPHDLPEARLPGEVARGGTSRPDSFAEWPFAGAADDDRHGAALGDMPGQRGIALRRPALLEAMRGAPRNEDEQPSRKPETVDRLRRPGEIGRRHRRDSGAAKLVGLPVYRVHEVARRVVVTVRG